MDTSLTAGATPREWRLAPGEIVSLWDMLQIHAKVFATLMESLGRIETAAGLGPPNVGGQAIDPHGEDGREVCRGLWDRAVDHQLEEVSAACEEVGLKHLVPHIRRIRKRFNDPAERWGFSELRQVVMDLGGLIKDGLNDSVFMHIPTSRLEYYTNAKLFGEEVADKFPKLAEDIAEAGKCFACGRFTASVFHLMRVMESALPRLAKLLKVTLPAGQSWGQMLTPIEAAAKQLPATTPREEARKQVFSDAVLHLRSFKDAWRNSTMHPKRTFTEEGAKVVFDCVKPFMQSLAKLK